MELMVSWKHMFLYHKLIIIRRAWTQNVSSIQTFTTVCDQISPISFTLSLVHIKSLSSRKQSENDRRRIGKVEFGSTFPIDADCRRHLQLLNDFMWTRFSRSVADRLHKNLAHVCDCLRLLNDFMWTRLYMSHNCKQPSLCRDLNSSQDAMKKNAYSQDWKQVIFTRLIVNIIIPTLHASVIQYSHLQNA